MCCVWNLIAYHIGPCFQCRRQGGRGDQEANRWRGNVRWRMLRLVWAEWDRRVYLVGTQKITQLGGWIRWKIWQWIVSSGEVVVISYQVSLFEDDCLIGQTEISVCWPRWCIFTLIPFHVYFITRNKIMIIRKLTLSTCCVAAAVVWSTTVDDDNGDNDPSGGGFGMVKRRQDSPKISVSVYSFDLHE